MAILNNQMVHTVMICNMAIGIVAETKYNYDCIPFTYLLRRVTKTYYAVFS